ncbi:MAG: spermidine synthase [Polyangiales bacterium]|jgi:spermidine synthase
MVAVFARNTPLVERAALTGEARRGRVRPVLALRVVRMATLYVALFASGSAALIYQTTWGRMLQRVFGVSDLAVATVLATFFLGLGLGSAAGGRFAKARKSSPARTYALLEVAVGGWALASLWFMPRIHDAYSFLGPDAGFGTLTTLRFLLAVLVLLPPTFFMGATLPVLIAAVSRAGIPWERNATFLYATNTLGAVAGAAATGLWLVPTYGARDSVVIAAGLSFGAALLVLVVWSRAGKAQEEEAPGVVDTGPSRPRLAMGLAAAAGLASLAGEVLWTRVLRLVVQGTTQAFAAMLTVFLFGIAMGSLIAAPLSRRFEARTLFGVLQTILGVLTLAAMYVGARLPQVVMLIQGETVVVPHEASVVLGAAMVLLLPLAIALGTSIPIAWRIAGGSADEAARNSGRVLAANTLGGLVGSLLAGFALVPLLGVARSIGFLAFLHFGIATAAFVAKAMAKPIVAYRDFASVLPLAFGAVALISPPDLHLPYLLDAWYDPSRALVEGPSAQCHEDFDCEDNDGASCGGEIGTCDDGTCCVGWDSTIRFLEEGRNTTVSILERDETLRLFNDGRPESGIGTDEPGFGEELATLGSLPVLHAAQRERAMVVGLGGAHSTAVVLGGPWTRVDVVELEGAIVDAARFLYESRDKDFPLDDPRTNLIVDDARAQLVLAPEGTYDAIISQPSHPWLAGSSALYTREFFNEAKAALRTGGVLALWSNLFRMDGVHLQRIVGTLRGVFEHVHAYMCEDSSFILAASDTPITYGSRFMDRLDEEGSRLYLRPFGLDDIVDYASVIELDNAGTLAFGADSEDLVDDRPALEFALARIPQADGLAEADVDYLLRDIPWMSAETFETFPAAMRVDVLLRRLEYIGDRYHAVERVRIALPDLPITHDERRLVEGAIAELRGDLHGALAAYREAVDDPEARYRLGVLLDAERFYTEQIQLQRSGARVDSPMFLFRAAIARRDRDAAQAALDAEASRNDTTDDPIAAIVRAWVAQDCDLLMNVANERPNAVDEEGAVQLAIECAFQQRDALAAARYAEQLGRNVRRVATEEVRMANEAETYGNDGVALRHYRRALNAHRFGHEEQATEVLRATQEHAHGLPVAENAVQNAARELGLDLTPPAPPEQ